MAHFTLPDGYLSFASPTRLMLFSPSLHNPDERCYPLERQCPFEMTLHTTTGRRLADFGKSEAISRVSDMHLLAIEQENGPPAPGTYLTLTDLSPSRRGRARQTRRVIGFDDPASDLLAYAFRWPALALVEQTSTPRLPDEITCDSGEYKPAGKPFLRIIDLAREAPPIAAPAIVLVRPPKPLVCPIEAFPPP